MALASGGTTPDYFSYAHWFLGQSDTLLLAVIGAVRLVLWEWDAFTEQRETRRKRNHRRE
jgi:hypothetical protein